MTDPHTIRAALTDALALALPSGTDTDGLADALTPTVRHLIAQALNDAADELSDATYGLAAMNLRRRATEATR